MLHNLHTVILHKYIQNFLAIEYVDYYLLFKMGARYFKRNQVAAHNMSIEMVPNCAVLRDTL